MDSSGTVTVVPVIVIVVVVVASALALFIDLVGGLYALKKHMNITDCSLCHSQEVPLCKGVRKL